MLHLNAWRRIAARPAALTLSLALLSAGAAQAGLVIERSNRSIIADTSASEQDLSRTSATSGAFIDTVVSTFALGQAPSTARAAMVTNLDVAQWLFFAEVELALAAGVEGSALTQVNFEFSVDSLTLLSGVVELDANDTVGDSLFQIERLGPQRELLVEEIDGLFNVDLTLTPGSYFLHAGVNSRGVGPAAGGRGDMTVQLAFLDAVQPPAAVSEPQSLALALLGLGLSGLGGLGVRRTRPAPAVPQAA